MATTATWAAVAGVGNWNTPTNWSPQTVPDGTAIFTSGTTTSVAITANASLDTLQFDPGAPTYFFSIANGVTLDLNGTGIVNNSGQSVRIDGFGTLNFNNAATAANATI